MSNPADEIEILFRSNGMITRRIVVSGNSILVNGGKTAQETQYLKRLGALTQEAAHQLRRDRQSASSGKTLKHVKTTDRDFKAMADYI